MSSSTSYLRPDYIHQLPSGISSTNLLDSSQSPLALLAQTCSSIGKEPSTTIPNVTLPKTIYSSLNNEKTTSKLNEIINTEKRSDYTSHHHKNEKLSPPPTTKITSSNVKNNNSGTLNFSTNSLAKSNQDNVSTSLSSSTTISNGLEIKKSQQPIITSSSRYTFEPQSYYNSLTNRLQRTTTPSSLSSFTHSYHMAAAAYSSLLDPYLQLLRADPLRSAALLAAYTFSKDETNLNLTCSDPYCRHCLLAHSQLPIPCTIPNCLQCELVRQPFVCNWVSAHDSAYCGKRYSNHDELLKHLRTAHTQDYYQSALIPSRVPTKPIPTQHRFHPYTKTTTNTSPSSTPNTSTSAAAAAVALASLPPHHFGFYPNLPLFGSR
ncbi:unnamed protein product [Didymodactylos carnosus]|uniref:C2H2-type domain-containing protein n=1 Tax=Didymodactylos carnosus TaxID=1234261 RepID=A0A813Y3N7_9BILA|nr:unnamed protein product [Didymodactylos carnosus]CAF0880483.1 unnamed protein product [Didymodactylos carnosus]CAF3504771.1 unnamed protein product [Didymodactylos carnosus]CAF3666776.1 unnamed protein product [Didymodactylos carnosus]